MNDDEMLDRMRAADPARHLPPLEPERAARLVEDTMNTQASDTHTRRNPIAWLAAAAAVAVIAGVAFWTLRGDDPEQPPVANETVTELQGPTASAYTARCMVPSAETLSTADVAFEGTVTSVEGDQVTLEATDWYAGDETDTVTITAPSSELTQLLDAVSFAEGHDYLVAAKDGRVMICGFSGQTDGPIGGEQLSELYAEAFAS